MKNILNFLVGGLITLVVIYLLASFIIWDFTPSPLPEWKPHSRAMLCFVVISGGLFGTLFGPFKRDIFG
jgi:hypothetical protein